MRPPCRYEESNPHPPRVGGILPPPLPNSPVTLSLLSPTAPTGGPPTHAPLRPPVSASLNGQPLSASLPSRLPDGVVWPAAWGLPSPVATCKTCMYSDAVRSRSGDPVPPSTFLLSSHAGLQHCRCIKSLRAPQPRRTLRRRSPDRSGGRRAGGIHAASSFRTPAGPLADSPQTSLRLLPY